MFRFIYRQRRRILFSTFFIMRAVGMALAENFSLFYPEQSVLWIVIAATIAAVAITSILVAAALALVIAFAPFLRTVAEFIALFAFLFQTRVLLLPNPPFPEVWAVAEFLVLLVVLHQTLYGPWLNSRRSWVNATSTRRFRSKSTPEDLWAKMVPGLNPSEAHWDKRLHRADPDPEDPLSFNVQYNHGRSVYEHQTMSYTDVEKPHRAKYFHMGEMDKSTGALTTGTYEVTLDPTQNGTDVIVTSCREQMLFSEGLLSWFDDLTGDRLDHIRAKERGAWDWSLTGRWMKDATRYA